MNASRFYLPTRTLLAMFGAASLLIIASCGEESTTPQSFTSKTTTVAKKPAELASLPRKGKVKAAVAPEYAVFGMRWFNTAENREYIFDGAEFVPRDNTVEDYYKTKEHKAKNTDKSVALTQDEVCDDGDACTPTGAHQKHGAYACSVCHKVAGRLVFDKNGPAHTQPYNASNLKPSFNATTKTCSNTACHTVPAGTFSYYIQGNEDYDGDGYPDPELKTVPYGGSAGQAAANWDLTGVSCAACHDNPPKYNGAHYVWHSGNHGGIAGQPGGGPNGALNQCQACHPDATSTGGVGTAITNPSLHGNGTVNVTASFKPSCFGCH